MVIKPCTDFSEPGIEFGLTYFDDPGVNIPAAVTAWVAISGKYFHLRKITSKKLAYQFLLTK